MKKLLLPFLAIVSMSCNNQATTSAQSADAAVNTKTETITESKPATNSGGCASLVLFKKGAVVESASYDAAGKETSSSITTVTDVTGDGGDVVANIEMKTKSAVLGERVIHMQYKCDGQNLKMDLGSMLSNFSPGTEIESVKPVEFPINISAGQMLQDASYTVHMKRGKMDMTITTTVKDRKVEAAESVTTAGGTWNCFKVTSVADASTTMAGADPAMSQKIADAMKKQNGEQKMIMWFAPDFGIVKTEMYMGEKLISRTEVKSVKL
jgi:hypothetical protein